MSELRDRAKNIVCDDLAALLELAKDVLWDLDALPNQIGAAEALQRSLHSLELDYSLSKLETVKARYAKLMMTL
ncbi:MAG TPA: hypothetical protein VGO04_13740 [Ensifer sp.]|jgi:hypothetical protein|uniref:hypothetical protein n=1 Tax=Ensifer sp. TaxID=1872086 RepID=UPI002E1205B9|nr:hypothetical protein [Ensifer sp.]